MIRLVVGSKGSGKTKTILKAANDEITTAKGNHIYITDNLMHTIDVDRRIRFINIKDYQIDNTDCFLGFLNGIIASDSDVAKIYIDGINRFLIKPEDMQDFILKVQKVTDEHKINLMLTISCDVLPDFLKRYV